MSPSARSVRQWVENGLNALLALDPGAVRRARRLEGKLLEVRIDGLGGAWRIGVREARLYLDGGPQPADARLSGGPFSLLALASSDGVEALFSGAVRIEGDTEVAKAFKRLLDTLDVDWEEQLARLVGDYPARRLGRAAVALARWGARSRRVLGEDLADYLQQEVELLAAPLQARALQAMVDRLRADADRLQARVERLERRSRRA